MEEQKMDGLMSEEFNNNHLELWKSAPRMSQPSKGFLVFKVPLGMQFDGKVEEGDIFTPSMLMEKMTGRKIPIGLVIDCTMNKTEFHEISEWNDWDVDYFKLPCDDQSALPSEAVCQDFMKRCAAFYNKNRNMLIGLMGLFGYHTAGYLYTRFLVEKCRHSVADALGAFQLARPPGLYCPVHLEALRRRYSLSDALAPPQPPAWDPELQTSRLKVLPAVDFQFPPPATPTPKRKRSYEEIQSSPNKRIMVPPGSPRSVGSSSPRSGSSTPVPGQWFKSALENTLHFPFNFGTELPKNSADWHKVFSDIFGLLGLMDQPETERGFYFPGAPGRRLTKAKSLTKETFVTWRAVGHRALIFVVGAERCFVVDKGLNCRKVSLRFPSPDNPDQYLRNTIIDGIFVDDHDPTSGQTIHRFLAFDLLVFQGVDITQKPLPSRLHRLQNGIINIRKRPDIAPTLEVEPFKIRFKEHFSLKQTAHLLKSFLPKLTHPVSGLIFTPINERYAVPGKEGKIRAIRSWEQENNPQDSKGSTKTYISEQELILSINRVAQL